jgi:antimicrobial peptide system SdpA family protein
MKIIPYFFIYTLITLAIIISITNNTIGFNPLTEKLEAKKIVFSFLPQGWAFFTRNPREGQAILYSIKKKSIFNTDFQHNNYNFCFGLNRGCNKIYTELSFINSDIPDSLFSKISWNYQSLLKQKINIRNLKVFNTTSPLKQSSLNGEYLLIIQKPIPWAWSKNINSIKMPAQAIIINIKK